MFYLSLGYFLSNYNMNKSTCDWVLVSLSYSISWVVFDLDIVSGGRLYFSKTGEHFTSHMLFKKQGPSLKDYLSAAEGMFYSFLSQIKIHKVTSAILAGTELELLQATITRVSLWLLLCKQLLQTWNF